ncbi:zinc finger protein-like [Tropilaelaps mercedesae]|uniref:Zinc finger protein-like n=1 Tax=Tropilaelaps mercedesae TaxID=418985 RepID=A0A1V9XF03_9ACAR|nr:zinc finger protein-like [Tropilaelaps mercedesae]
MISFGPASNCLLDYAGDEQGPLVRADDLVPPIVLTGPPQPNEAFSKGDGLFFCHNCSYSSKRIDHMRRHIWHRHSLYKPYLCVFCKKKFSRDASLKDHIRTMHTGETPYQCKLCTQAFTSSYNLWQHSRVQHNGTK